MERARNDPDVVYEIQVQGQLDRGWEDWLTGLSLTHSYTGDRSGTTTLTGPVADQSALRGMLCKLWDLNLTVLSVRRIEQEGKDDGKPETV